jgi:hypothetical protein
MKPEDFSSRLSFKGVAQIALLSILLDPLHERSRTPDAQEKLWQIFHWVLKHSELANDDGSTHPANG